MHLFSKTKLTFKYKCMHVNARAYSIYIDIAGFGGVNNGTRSGVVAVLGFNIMAPEPKRQGKTVNIESASCMYPPTRGTTKQTK